MLNLANRPHRRSGITVVWLVLSLAAIIGVTAIGLDGGQLLSMRIHCQATADAAALAAAGQLYASYPTNGGLDNGSASAAALQMTAANGIVPGSSGNSVSVNIPPLQGDFAGQRGYAEVIVRQSLAASFSAIFGYSNLTVSARAVARGVMVQGAGKGFYVLRSSGGQSLQAGKDTNVTIVNASLYVNDTDNNAVKLHSHSTITASSFEFMGGHSNPGTLNGPVNRPAAPAPDPFAAVPPPNFANYPVQSGKQLTVSTTVSLAPGVYVGGLVITTRGIVTLQPGIYILSTGGLNMQGGTLQGTGVVIYNGAPPGQNAGPLSMVDQSTVNLSPPTSGTYTGLSIYQDRRSNQLMTISAAHNKQITGAIYAAGAEVDLVGPTDNGTLDTLGGAVACLLTQIQGNFQVNSTNNSGPAKSLYGLVD